MTERFSDDALRSALRSLPPPPVPAALAARVRDDAPRRAASTRPRWVTGVALAALVLAVAAGLFEYRAWQETEELAQLDELSITTMLVL
jgi:anti-sigma factor RsiW